MLYDIKELSQGLLKGFHKCNWIKHLLEAKRNKMKDIIICCFDEIHYQDI